jgi:hypothetical protein
MVRINRENPRRFLFLEGRISTMACLVWLSGLRGPAAEVWRDHIEVYRRRSEAQILSFRKLTDPEAYEPLDRLIRKYPLERQAED